MGVRAVPIGFLEDSIELLFEGVITDAFIEFDTRLHGADYPANATPGASRLRACAS